MNQLCQVSSVTFFWKGEEGRIENGKYQLLKIDKSCYIVIRGPGTSFQSPVPETC